MKKLYFMAVAFLYCISTAQAEFALFADKTIHSIHLIKEMVSVMKKDGEVFTFQSPNYSTERGGEKTKWVSMYIDLKNERISVRWVETLDRPVNFNKPDQIRLYVDKTYYDITHTQKRAYTDTIDFRQLTSYFTLNGWFYDGINLQQEIDSIPNEQFKSNEDGLLSIVLEQPKTNFPAEIFVNKDQNKVVKTVVVNEDPRLGEDQKITTNETFEWDQIPNTDFWYPKYVHTVLDGVNGVQSESKTWIREIYINPIIPDGIFNTDFPSTYQNIDRRKLLKPLRF